MQYSNMPYVHQKSIFWELLYCPELDSSNLQPFFLDLEKNISRAKQFYKHQARDTTTVALVEYKQNLYVIKRYNFRNFLHAIKLQFRKSHGFRSFLYADTLSRIGIPTIKPIAVIQKKIGLLKKQSYFISQYAAGVPGCVYFKDGSIFKNDWQETIDLMFTTVKKMRENCIYHGDFHFGNFIIVNNQPLLLDFDRIRIPSQNQFKNLHLKDLKNFYRYLKNNEEACELFKKHPDFKQCFGFLSRA